MIVAGRVHCDAKAGCASNEGVATTKLCAGSECKASDKKTCCVEKVKLAKLGYGGVYKEIGKVRAVPMLKTPPIQSAAAALTSEK